MSGPRSSPSRLSNWIPSSFAWTTAPDAFCIDVSVEDPDMVEFISTGIREIEFLGTKKTARTLTRFLQEKSLRRQLSEAVWASVKLKPTSRHSNVGTKVVAHCYAVYLLPDGKSLCVVVGRSKLVAPDTWISAALKAEADRLLAEHQAKVVEFDKSIKLRRQANDALKARYKSDQNFGEWADTLCSIEEHYHRPIATVEPLLSSLPRAAKFQKPTSGDLEKLVRAAGAAIAASGWPPSRDGNYVGFLLGAAGRRTQSLVSWVPHTGLPSYPEIRWAVQKRLPAALCKPRIEQIGKPKLDIGSKPVADPVLVRGLGLELTDIENALEDLQLDLSDYRNRVADVRKDAKLQGFEAIAWFQAYHVWTEETWGIYFDAYKLDALALSLLEDFKSQRIHGSHSLAGLLALGLTYAHELFHARVEAALSWTEINAQRPRHRRYKERVYQALRETPKWLEEALANWSAWNWFKAPGVQSLVARMTSNAKGMERVVAASLDLAPPGYQEWRLGDQPSTWRTFANQLSTGTPMATPAGMGLPLESALTGPLPYDLQPDDIPLRFVGAGVIADRIQSHPATFNVPSRREMERALKHFRHSLDSSGGKGGHQKWTGPDQRAFILPTRDPVSTGVFKTFLHHLGIDKATYVRQIRPNL
jgi:hypothetical protein